MPVLDHEVHESTIHDRSEVNGCKNRTGFAPGYWAPNRIYLDDGRYINTQKWIPHTLSTKCRAFMLWDTDPACQGCTAPKDTEYRDQMQGLK